MFGGDFSGPVHTGLKAYSIFYRRNTEPFTGVRLPTPFPAPRSNMRVTIPLLPGVISWNFIGQTIYVPVQ